MSGKKKTTMAMTLKTRQRLDRFGHKGETYDDVLNRLLDAVEEGGIFRKGGEL